MKIFWKLGIEKYNNGVTKAAILGAVPAYERPANRTRMLPYGVAEIRYYDNPDAAAKAGKALAMGEPV